MINIHCTSRQDEWADAIMNFHISSITLNSLYQIAIEYLVELRNVFYGRLITDQTNRSAAFPRSLGASNPTELFE